MNILLVSYNSRKIAEAISSVLDCTSPEIISIPIGYNNIKELINIVYNSTSKVVLIENTIDNISENIYLSLLKENKDKLLIFSIESSENLEIIPTYIYNYLTKLDIELLVEEENKNDDFVSGTTDLSIFTPITKFNSKCISQNLSKIEKVKKLNYILKKRYSRIMKKIDTKEEDTLIFSILVFSVLNDIKTAEQIDSLKLLIRSDFFEGKRLKKLELLIKEAGINV